VEKNRGLDPKGVPPKSAPGRGAKNPRGENGAKKYFGPGCPLSPPFSDPPPREIPGPKKGPLGPPPPLITPATSLLTTFCGGFVAALLLWLPPLGLIDAHRWL